jgi:integrase
LAKFITDALDISEDLRSLCYPNRKIQHLTKPFSEIKKVYEGKDLLRLTTREKLLFMRSQTMDSSVKRTRRTQVLRLFNLFQELKNPSNTLAGDAGMEILRSHTTDILPSKETTEWNIPKFLRWWKERPLSQDWIDIRDDAIIMYQLVSGRRASNVSCAVFPKYWIKGKAMFFQEFATKGDRLCKGINWTMLSCSIPEICPIRTIERYLNHPITKNLIKSWKSNFPNNVIPLIFADLEASYMKRKNQRVPCRLSPDRISSITKTYMLKAGIRFDNLNRQVDPRQIRHTILTRASAGGIGDHFIRQMQGRKQEKHDKKHYLINGCLARWTDFVFYVSEHCSSSPSSYLKIHDMVDTEEEKILQDDNPGGKGNFPPTISLETLQSHEAIQGERDRLNSSGQSDIISRAKRIRKPSRKLLESQAQGK